MNILGILDGIGILLMIVSLPILIINGLKTETEQYWFGVIILGFILWGFMAFDFTKKTTSIKLPIRYRGFEWVPPESHATGFIIWLVVLIGSLSCVGIELRLDPFRIELLLPMIISVVISVRITILTGERGVFVIKDFIIKQLRKHIL